MFQELDLTEEETKVPTKEIDFPSSPFVGRLVKTIRDKPCRTFRQKGKCYDYCLYSHKPIICPKYRKTGKCGRRKCLLVHDKDIAWKEEKETHVFWQFRQPQKIFSEFGWSTCHYWTRDGFEFYRVKADKTYEIIPFTLAYKSKYHVAKPPHFKGDFPVSVIQTYFKERVQAFDIITSFLSLPLDLIYIIIDDYSDWSIPYFTR